MTETHRPIRSFVLRQGRMSRAQRLACDELLPIYGIPFARRLLDFERVFERRAPTILEIGFGMGETTAHIATQQPEHNFVGIEVHSPGVGSLLRQITDKELTNVRVIQHDAVEVVQDMIAPQSLRGIHVFFPDPWPKKRHHKRRLLQPDFVKALSHRLEQGGYLHVATDWQAYAEHILEVLTAEPALENSAARYAPRPEHRPQTKFETRGLRLGHGVWDVIFFRR
jgi:tRNA (guanine-N7-)-methyltransferase